MSFQSHAKYVLFEISDSKSLESLVLSCSSNSQYILSCWLSGSQFIVKCKQMTSQKIRLFTSLVRNNIRISFGGNVVYKIHKLKNWQNRDSTQDLVVESKYHINCTNHTAKNLSAVSLALESLRAKPFNNLIWDFNLSHLCFQSRILASEPRCFAHKCVYIIALLIL